MVPMDAYDEAYLFLLRNFCQENKKKLSQIHKFSLGPQNTKPGQKLHSSYFI